MHVIKHAEDAAAACRDGAVLLSIARVDNDEEAEGFRFLIGLERGVEMTPYLKNFF
jgi:hypothetical protein